MLFSRDSRNLTIADTIGVATLNAVAPRSKKVTSTPRLEEFGLSPHLTASTLPRRLRSMGIRAVTRFKLPFILLAFYIEVGVSAHGFSECEHKGCCNAEELRLSPNSLRAEAHGCGDQVQELRAVEREIAKAQRCSRGKARRENRLAWG